MQIFPVGFLFVAFFLLARLKSPQAGFIAAMSLVPLGAFAFLNFGDFSFIAYHAAFLIMIALAVARHLISPKRHQFPRFELAAIFLLILIFYALVTSQLMPRIFAGDVWVFSLQSGVVGQRVSPYFYSTVSLLQPSSGNISQPIYLVLSAFVFLLASRMSRRYGTDFLDKSIFLAAAVNGTMGALDFVGADAFLQIFKTAGYSFMVDVGVSGVTRIVGVFTEGSAMGGISAVLFAYMMMRYLDTGKRSALILAALNFLWGVLALSSTGFVALASAGTFIVWRSGRLNLSKRINPRIALRFLVVSALMIVGFAFILLFTNFGDTAWSFIDKLIFQKGTSLSALERGSWAKRGIAVGFETYGLGAGFGSTLSNGLFSVLFSNLGVVGIVLYGAFLFSILRAPRKEFNSAIDLGLYNAAAASIVTFTVAQLISATTADPGILFMVFAAIAVSSRPAKYMRWTLLDRTRRPIEQRIARGLIDP
ncbi:MAG: hypothetical protein EX271_12735 [Acidimicrobiales bacterium]|nr:hypothetical protein [Hyphomonadaceae bacterium]RZV35706.1 MAG: hypothetical protein EX271_12735 [Acidimicrobiales bacterium]